MISIDVLDFLIKISQTSALKTHEQADPNAIPNEYYDDEAYAGGNQDHSHVKTSNDEEIYRITMKNQTMKWISLSLVCITILCLLLVGTIIWLFTCGPKKKHGNAEFESIRAVSSNV
jgi:hypothetical protein